jgi:phospholipid/cholesterol/gamma-HCH transport system substrate-binding protein
MKRRDEIVVGLVTLIAVVFLIGGMVWLARGGLSRGYPLYAKFEWGAGLKQGQPVLFSGANIGYVDDIILRDDGGLVSVLRIYKDKHVPDGTIANIAPYGFFGDQLIALKNPPQGPTGRFYQPGDTIPTGKGSIQIGDIIARVDTMTRSLNEVVTTLNTSLKKDNPLAYVRRASQSADSLFRVVSVAVKEQSAQLRKTQEDLLHAVNAIDSARIAPLVLELREATANASKLVSRFDSTNTHLRSILAKVDSGNGSAARLLNSPKMEEDIRAALTRLDSLLADFKANPKKYIKFSIF